MAKDGYRAIYPSTLRRLLCHPDICSCDRVCLTPCNICDQHFRALPWIERPEDRAMSSIYLRQPPRLSFPYPTPYKRLRTSSYVYPYAETVTDYSMSDFEGERVWERNDGLAWMELPPSAIPGCVPLPRSRARSRSPVEIKALAKQARVSSRGEEKKTKQPKKKRTSSSWQPASPITPSPVSGYDNYSPHQGRKRPSRKAPLIGARPTPVRRPPGHKISADYAPFHQERRGRASRGLFGSDEQWLSSTSPPRHRRAEQHRRAYDMNVGANGQYNHADVGRSHRRPRISQDEEGDEYEEDNNDFEYYLKEWGRPQVNRGTGPQVPPCQTAFNLNDVLRNAKVKIGRSKKDNSREDPTSLFYERKDNEANATKGEEEGKKKAKPKTPLELTTGKPDSYFRKSCKGRQGRKGGRAYETFGLDRRRLEDGEEEELDSKGRVKRKPYVNVVDLKTGERTKRRIRGYEKVPQAIKIFAGVEQLEGPIPRLTRKEWEERNAEKESRTQPRQKRGKGGGCVVM